MANQSRSLLYLFACMASAAWAAEPAAPAPVTPRETGAHPAPASPVSSFDLKSQAVKDILRATAATQASMGYRIEPAPRQKPDLAEALRVERPAEKPRVTRINPPEPAECDGFLSCGVETLLDVALDRDDYAPEPTFRNQRVLAGAHGFEDSFSCSDPHNLLSAAQRYSACGTSSPPPSPAVTSGAGTELRPRGP